MSNYPDPLLQTVSIATDPTSTCSNCRFASTDVYGSLRCRAQAPAPAVSLAPFGPQGNPNNPHPNSGIWPVVKPEDWCGIWAPLTPGTPYFLYVWNATPKTVPVVTEYPSLSAANAASAQLTAAGFVTAIVPRGI